MENLFLEDLKGMSVDEVVNHIIEEYEVIPEQLSAFDILVAYESVGSWGCDSSSYFLLRNKLDQKLYEVHGSHCSCHGFEGQFEPEETHTEYLKSSRFRFFTGGYDTEAEENELSILNYMKELQP